MTTKIADDDFYANFAFVVYNENGKFVSWTHSTDKEAYAVGCGHASKAAMIEAGYPVDQYSIVPNPNPQ